jgi:uncharacterized protein YxeA
MALTARNMTLKMLDFNIVRRDRVSRYLAFTYKDRYVLGMEAIHFCDMPYSQVKLYTKVIA